MSFNYVNDCESTGGPRPNYVIMRYPRTQFSPFRETVSAPLGSRALALQKHESARLQCLVERAARRGCARGIQRKATLPSGHDRSGFFPRSFSSSTRGPSARELMRITHAGATWSVAPPRRAPGPTRAVCARLRYRLRPRSPAAAQQRRRQGALATRNARGARRERCCARHLRSQNDEALRARAGQLRVAPLFAPPRGVDGSPIPI